jgi:hypothetical protein
MASRYMRHLFVLNFKWSLTIRRVPVSPALKASAQ